MANGDYAGMDELIPFRFPTLVSGVLQGYQPLRGRTDGPCGPRVPAQSVHRPGAGYVGSPSRSPGLTWAVSTIRARTGRCRESGLSSTDERVRGRATHGYFRYGYSIHGYSPFSSIAHTYCKSIAVLGQKYAILKYKYPAIHVQPSGEYPKVSMYPCVARVRGHITEVTQAGSSEVV